MCVCLTLYEIFYSNIAAAGASLQVIFVVFGLFVLLSSFRALARIDIYVTLFSKVLFFSHLVSNQRSSYAVVVVGRMFLLLCLKVLEPAFPLFSLYTL